MSHITFLEEHITFLEEHIYTSLNHLNDKSLPSIFEYYCAIFLSKKHNENFYVWKDILPSIKENLNVPTNDKGIDISNETFTNLNQVKYYGKNTIICYSKLSTFLAFGTFFTKEIRDNISYSLLRTDHSKLSKNVKHFVSIGNLNDYPISKEKFLQDLQDIKQRYQNRLVEYEEKEFILRPPQIEGINLIERSDIEKKNCSIQLPTGIGKTVMFIQYIKKTAGKFLVLIPTLVLLEQWFEVLKGNRIKKVYKIGTHDNNTFTDTNLKESEVVLCVFNSFYLVKEYIQEFKRICVDEAHNIFRPEIYIDDYEDVEDDSSEETYMESIRRSFKDNNNFLLMSATIDLIDDCLYYSYKIRDGIEDGYLTDYQIILPIFDDDPTDTNIAEYLVRKGELHCIVYASTIAECEKFTGILNSILPNSAAYIHSGVNEKVRKSVIKKFNESRIRFLVNVRVLSEGFNSEICSSICFLHLSSNDTFIIQSIGRSLRLCEGKNVSNIYLPFNKDSDLDNFKVFIQQLSNSDERIRRSCKEKNIGGYVNIESVIKEDESEEKKEEDEEKYSKIEYRYDMVYDSVEIKEKLSGEEKVKALIEFYEKNQRLPRQKEEYTYKEVVFSIGTFWDGIKQGKCKKLYDQYLSNISIFKEDYERVQKLKIEKKNKKELTSLEKVEALIEYNKIPKTEQKYIYKEIKFNIGSFWNDIKQGINKKLYEQYLSNIDIFKENYERVQKLKIEKKNKKELTSLEKVKALIEYNKIPRQKEEYIYKEVVFSIGTFWDNIKRGQSKVLYDQYLSNILIFKEDYDRMQKLKIEKKDKRELTTLEKVEALIEYNKIPKTEQKYIYKEIPFKIGRFWIDIKQGKCKKLYDQHLSSINIFSKSYERTQKLKEEKKLKKN